jgi:DNA-binding NarL/FixJ family response regulator
MRFKLDATQDGTLPVEQAASLLAMHCLVRGQKPEDYTVLVVPRGSTTLLNPVGQRAQELLETWHEFGQEVELSPREQEVLGCVVRRLSNKEIGQQLNVSERTVKFHVSSLFAKFKVRDRLSLMRQATIGMIPSSAAPIDSLFGFPMPASGK